MCEIAIGVDYSNVYSNIRQICNYKCENKSTTAIVKVFLLTCMFTVQLLPIQLYAC